MLLTKVLLKTTRCKNKCKAKTEGPTSSMLLRKRVTIAKDLVMTRATPLVAQWEEPQVPSTSLAPRT